MRGRGGRGTWRQPPPPPHAPFAPPTPFHPPPPQQPSFPPFLQPQQQPPAAARADVSAFVEALRSSRSQPSAPPSALSVGTAVHAICAHFQVGSVEELVGVAPLQLPALRQLHTLNQRVWTFVTCFVQTRRINTLYECFQAFLAQEGVHDFHELRIGNSFLHTEAVQTLYHAPTAMLNVSTRDILTHLRQFEAILGHDAFRNSSHIDRSQFLQYLSQQYRQPDIETLGIAIDPAGFGVYIALLRRLSNQEVKEMKAIEQEFQKGIAAKVFEVTKEKFSAENRKQALDELLKTHLLTAASSEQEAAGANGTRGKKKIAGSTTSSLSLEMLKRVTDIDVYLDNVLRRKAAAGALANHKQISSQEIAETDLKIRNQLTRFLMTTQKSKHHSRIKVVTWVLCGIMAKIHSLLLHDDKLPDAKSRGGVENDDDGGNGEHDDDDESSQKKQKRLGEDSDGESGDECDCCCVGKDTCKCSCSCECHSSSSDEDEEAKTEVKSAAAATSGGGKSAKSTKVVAEPKAAVTSSPPVDVNVVKQEVARYLTTYCESNEIESLEQLLMCFISLEIHLQHSGSGHPDRSALELVLDLWNDGTDKDKTWYQSFERLIDESQGSSSSILSVADRTEVTKFMQQCYSALCGAVSSARMPKDDMLQLLAARARSEFGYDVTEKLGLGGGDALLALAEESTQPQSTGKHGLVKYSSALLPQSDASLEPPGESLRSKKTEEAIDALRQSPYLVDVAQCTQWQQRFAPSCGALRSFIRTHEMILLDHASLMFLFCWNGVVVRVDESSTPSTLELLISGADSNERLSSPRTLPPSASVVAVHLVSMLAKCGGPQNYPTQLLQAHLRQLFSLVTGADATTLERYVLDILLVVPVELADFLFAPETCRAWIAQIRKEQFGIGLEIQDEATSAVLVIQQQRLERALKRLSDELYSENTHFVLELLQNADDNNYNVSVRAKGEFTLTRTKQVVFYNNERGFSRTNIQAICDVGASTKSSCDSSASIGKKGIGFKSVFKISDSPEVHSNGFHIRFHAKNEAHGGGLGYILPFWIESESEWQMQPGTTFVLPLNSASVQQVDEISESLMTFDPSILLFLRRIQELCITDQVHDQKLHFLKEAATRSSGHQIVRLFSQVHSRTASATDGAVVSQHEWLVVKTRLEAPRAFAEDDDQVRETELAIALPMDASGNGDRAPLQQVFAYLPLRSYGFRFVIQGDFEVPSSREAIVNGSEWNQWLVSQIPRLMGRVVVCFVDELRRTKGGGVVSRIAHLLSLLPFESEIQAPFRSIVHDTMREVSQTPFLPAESASSSLELVKPTELLDAWEAVQDDEILDVFARDEALLASALKKKVLLVELSKMLQPQQKALLRVEKLKASHVLQLLTHAAAKDDPQWVVGMLRALCRLWKRDRHADLLLQELRLIKCFPLESEEAATKWVSLADVGDALFLASVGKNDSVHGASSSLGSSSFYEDLHVLQSDFSVAVNKMADVRAFLVGHVKVKTIEDHDLIAHHILPKVVLLDGALGAAREEDSDDLSIAALRIQLHRYSRFIAAHLLRCTVDCSLKGEIQASMRVWTCTEKLVSAASAPNVYVLLPSVEKETPGLSRWLRERVRESRGSVEPFDLVAFDESSAGEVGEEALRKLFIETLCLPALLDVTHTRAAFALKHVLKWLQAESSAKLKEMVSEELAQHLDKRWSATTMGETPSESIDDAGSDVVDMLRKSKWLSGSDGKLHRPSKLWIPTPAFKALLADTATPYSRISWTNERFTSEVLRLKQTPTLADALDALARLAQQEGKVNDISDVRRIYSFLSEQAERSSSSVVQTIKQAFSERLLVFAPRSESKGGGGFFAVKDVVWSATSCASHLIPLEQCYPKALRQFFTEVCGVERKPSVGSLCDRLVQMKAFPCHQDAKKKWKREVLPILQFFAKQIKKAALPKLELRRIRKTLKAVPWIPTVASASASWCTSKDAPIVCESDDELEVQKLVTGLRKECGVSLQSADIQLAKLDPGVLEELEPLLKLAKIRSLTVHAVSRPSVWCDLVVEAASAFGSAGGTLAAASSSARKRVYKLLKRLVVSWAKAFALNPSVWVKTDIHFQAKLQQSAVFPTLLEDGEHFLKPADMYINDQTELAKESFSPGLQPALPILALFPWSYFVDAEKSSGDAARVRGFLLSFCGAQSLKTQLVCEVSVLGSCQTESALLRTKIQQSLSVAQRLLFHHHRELYEMLPHAEILKLAHDVRCAVLPHAGALQVIYRVGGSFSIRQSPSSCYLDTAASVLYVVTDSTSEDEWGGRLHEVLVEVCRKCFGSQLAASVANLLYLASMQPSAEAMERWLADTQQLALIDSAQAGTPWAPPSSSTELPSLSGEQLAKKRSFSSLEEGEVEEDHQKRARSGTGQQWTPPASSGSAIFPPLPPADGASSRQSADAWPPPLPPGAAGGLVSLPGALHQFPQQLQQQQQLLSGGPFQPPLPPLPPPPQPPLPSRGGAGPDHVVRASNPMSKEERAGIGRWGEEYVFKQLSESHKDNTDVTVEWVNEHEESGKPYDITVSSRGKVVEYVEVKATRTMEKAVFEISMNELDQAAIHGSSYCIYRVFNAGNDALCRVVRMKNPVALVRQKKVQLALVMQ